MQLYEVAGEELRGVDFSPSSELKEVLQNVRTILTTRKGSVPLDRDFGIDTSVIDQPINRAGAMLMTNIIEAVEAYEPRASVIDVTFSGNGEEGEIIPVVKVAIK